MYAQQNANACAMRRLCEPYQRGGDPEGLVLQLLHHLVVDLGGGERIIDSPRLRPDPRLLGS
jgi:hypothetical protein